MKRYVAREIYRATTQLRCKTQSVATQYVSSVAEDSPKQESLNLGDSVILR